MKDQSNLPLDHDLRLVDAAEQHLLDNVTGLLNLHTARNPYGFGMDQIDKVKTHRAKMKIIAETLVHRIEREGPSVETLQHLANVKNDLAEYGTAQIIIDQMLSLAESSGRMTQNSIAFMMTDKCNLRCKHCFIFNEAVFKAVPRTDEMSSADYVKMFKSLAARREKYNIHITGGGEIFARSDFEHIMHDIAVLGTGLTASIQTNGHFPDRLSAMLGDDATCAFVETVQFSLDGLQQVHNQVRGNGNFDKLVQSIAVAREYGKDVSVITTVLDDNIDGLADILSFSKSLGVKNHRFQLFFEGSKLGLAQISKATDFITERDRSLVYHDWTAPGRGCLAGIRTCVVRPDGTIETCRESYSGNVPRMFLVDVRKYDYDLPAALTSAEAFRGMRNVKNCVGCAAFCAR